MEREVPQLSISDLERFGEKIDIGEEKECWEWLSTKSGGYGQFSINGIDYQAHIISYMIHYAFNSDLFVCHHCDNPSCVNPKHLYQGTQSDNLRDAARKGRLGKLDPEEIREIYKRSASGELPKEIAKSYPVSEAHISRIYLGRTCKEITKDLRERFPPKKRKSKKLSVKEVKEIYRKAYSGNETQREIADNYGVSKKTIYRIKSGKHWSEVTNKLSKEGK